MVFTFLAVSGAGRELLRAGAPCVRSASRVVDAVDEPVDVVPAVVVPVLVEVPVADPVEPVEPVEPVDVVGTAPRDAQHDCDAAHGAVPCAL